MNFKHKIAERFGKKKPFLSFQVFGEKSIDYPDGILVYTEHENIIPLTIEITPPTQMFAASNDVIMNLITRYSKTFNQFIEAAKKNAVNKEKFSRRVLQELKEGLEADEDNLYKQLALATQIGENVIKELTQKVYWNTNKEEIPAKIVFSFEEEVEGNEKEDGISYIWVNRISETERIQVGMSMIDALPREDAPIAQIPMTTNEYDEETGETKEVVGSIPADTFRGLPRQIRTHPMENPTSRG